MLTIQQCVAITGKSRSTIVRAIKDGTLSAKRAGKGGKNAPFLVDPAELARVYPEADEAETSEAEALLREQLEMAREQIEDLQKRLDVSEDERRHDKGFMLDVVTGVKKLQAPEEGGSWFRRLWRST